MCSKNRFTLFGIMLRERLAFPRGDLLIIDQNGTEIIDIRECGAGGQEIAE